MENKIIKSLVTSEEIDKFINGRDSMERIVNLEYSAGDNFVTIFYRDENDNKCVTQDYFYPFLWATKDACRKLCNGNKNLIRENLEKYSIKCVGLRTTNAEGENVKEIENGYTVKFEAIVPMSYSRFLEFFKTCGNPVFSKVLENNLNKNNKQYLTITPREQYLISSGKRFFKGYDDYNQLLRLVFDIESTGLDTKKDRIEKFGIRFNRPVKYKNKDYIFEKIYNTEGDTEEEKNASELNNIRTFLKIIYTFSPDIITAHNGEAFDWNIIIGACERLGTSLEAESMPYFKGKFIYKDKKETILKLGGEIETFNRTIVPGCIVTDSLHAVRRAQALDSNMLEANLKYVTVYSEMNKVNRVYVPGDLISKIGNDYTEKYAFNNENGDWYIYDKDSKNSQDSEIKPSNGKFILKTLNFLKDGYELKTGHYIIDRYLLDDLWECDAVEHRYNTSNFLICKMLPIPFDKCCTMGTAGQWKALLMAWSYENNLAIPPFGERKSFTGGLSRLLKVGYVKDVAKFDYNSLYPSITLTWGIKDETDLMGSTLYFLEYVLSRREKYKALKKKAGKQVDIYEEKIRNKTAAKEDEDLLRKYAQEESANDKKQLPLKIFANSFFGSYGAPNVFPWGSLKCAERITCTGRQCLRLMISHFNNLGYSPIVGDSFKGDTPLFIKRDDGLIDIVKIENLIDKNEIKTDLIGREFDYSAKKYKVLSRNGWITPSYIYRHKTWKDIYEVQDNNALIEVTEDHSLFDKDKNKIKPSQISDSTELEYYESNDIFNDFNFIYCSDEEIKRLILSFIENHIDNSLFCKVLNSTIDSKKRFIAQLKNNINLNNKDFKAKILFIENCIKNNGSK